VVERGAKSAAPQRGAQSVAKKRHHRDSPLDAVRAFVRALNTVSACDDFRKERERLRLAGEPLDGLRLAAFLPKHLPGNHLGAEELSAIITANQLTRFDRARLEPNRPAS
jgi:uncharacterized FlgJ-related protein